MVLGSALAVSRWLKDEEGVDGRVDLNSILAMRGLRQREFCASLTPYTKACNLFGRRA
jgi:hypothetical protein